MTTNNVLTYLEASIKSHPKRMALKDANKGIAYGDLGRLCQNLAILFLDKVDKKLYDTPKPVVVYIDRNIESIIAFLAVVYSGNFYVPVDASFPRERLAAINESLNPLLFIDARNKGKEIPGAISIKTLIEGAGGVLSPEETDNIHEGQTPDINWGQTLDNRQGQTPDINGGQTLEDEGELTLREIYRVKSGPSDKDEFRLKTIRENALSTDPLYSIFTSGTTGVPKGVLISHGSVIDLVEQFDLAFDFPESPVFGNQAPFDFDVSVKDIYNSLKRAGCVVIIPKSHFVMSAALFPYLKENGVNVIIWAVSALRIVENFKLFDECIPDKLSLIMFSGEVMPPRTLNYLKNHLPKAVYVNLYGPTEITCNCNYYIVDRDFGDEDVLPIGRAFNNTRVFLRDPETGHIIYSPETLGEICVEGASLALGYYNNQKETDKAFIQRPGVSAYRDMIYCTGDLGKYNADGELFYVCRKDYQIKHMGHRIELGEIEAVVNAMEGIYNGCCVYYEEKELIVLFYSGTAPADKEIRAAIRAVLPGYMMPNKIQFLEKMPMNNHDKTDRKKLLEMAKEV